MIGVRGKMGNVYRGIFLVGVFAGIGVFGSVSIFAGGGLNEDPGARIAGNKGVGAASGNLIGHNEGDAAGQVISFGKKDGPDFTMPLPGLTSAQLKRFMAGRLEFDREQFPDDGLGPVFNEASCFLCHSAGGSGGASGKTVERFGILGKKGGFDPLSEFGGSLRQALAIDMKGVDCAEVVPAEATVMTLRLTTPTFGSGLIEAIPDETILALEDPTDEDGDGISGRAHIVMDPIDNVERVGRFGWKAQVATLDTFSADAQLQETGITNVVFSEDNDPNGIRPPLLDDCDLIEDPEDIPDMNGVSNFNRMADFQRFLAPIPRLPTLSNRGFFLFRQIGCADCHTPVMFTGNHEVAALSNKPVFLFSDLLLHDMGSLGDQIEQGDAEGFEMRTSPLWGLRVRSDLLHDGRSQVKGKIKDRIEHAIGEHAGEAAASRDAFLKLKKRNQRALINFLESI